MDFENIHRFAFKEPQDSTILQKLLSMVYSSMHPRIRINVRIRSVSPYADLLGISHCIFRIGFVITVHNLINFLSQYL